MIFFTKNSKGALKRAIFIVNKILSMLSINTDILHWPYTKNITQFLAGNQQCQTERKLVV